MIDNIHNEIAKSSKLLMFKEPFYGLFLIGLNKKLSNNILTACVCKENINLSLMINPDFWEKQDDNTKVGILKHELLHIVFHHLTIWDKFKNKELLNIAADLEVNQYIEDVWKGKTWNGLCINKEPFKELKLPKKAGIRVYYDLLMQEIKNNPSGDIANMVCVLSDAAGHEMWKEFENMSEADKKLIGKQVDHQLQEVAKQIKRGRGTVPSELEQYINGLSEVEEPVIDWRAYLRRFNGMAVKIFTKKTRRKLNKRFVGNPALKIKQRKNTLVAIDTSGSVSNQDLVDFFNEIHHIYKTGTEIDIIECDAAIQRVYQYKGKNEELIKVKGRGGTEFEPVIQYLNQHKDKYQNMIYLTDGECPIPKSKPIRPILWVITNGGNIKTKFPGQLVQITR